MPELGIGFTDYNSTECTISTFEEVMSVYILLDQKNQIRVNGFFKIPGDFHTSLGLKWECQWEG